MKHAYSDGIYNKRIAMFGPLPPPLGGVSVHVERVIEKLRTQRNVVEHFDTTLEIRYRFFVGYMAYFLFFLLRMRPHIIIYHTSYISNALWEQRLLVLYAAVFKSRLMWVEHDCRYVYTLSEKHKKKLRVIFSSVHEQIFIGSLTKQSFMGNGLAVAGKISCESAFLPPPTQQRAALLPQYPQEMHIFIDAHFPIIIANAFQLSLFEGKDLYGFDQLVSVCALLKNDFHNLGLILMLAQQGDATLSSALQKQVDSLAMRNHVYILLGNYILWPLFGIADLFVRPTLSDGASVSVEEALYCGTKVIASDVCWRPAACALYPSGDVTALYEVLKKELYGTRERKRDYLYAQSER